MAETASSGGDARYKIGDVCRIADVQPYVLRYWESEFPLLAPDKSVPGPRTYSAHELKLIEQIKRLLYDEGYTIAGAKKRLEAEGGGKTTSAADTNPIVSPLPGTISEKPEKAAKAEKPDRAEKAERPSPEKAAARPARPARPPAPRFSDAVEIELPAPEITLPAAATSQTAVAVEAPAPAADARIVRAVAELKEILAVLSRPAP